MFNVLCSEFQIKISSVLKSIWTLPTHGYKKTLKRASREWPQEGGNNIVMLDCDSAFLMEWNGLRTQEFLVSVVKINE